MAILITGGCGFIGCNLIARLHAQGIREIRILDNESLGRRDWIDEFDTEFMCGDVRDNETVSKALDGIDTVVHLAADTRVIDSIKNPVHNYDVNVRGTFVLLEAMRKAGVKRIVSASTGGAIIGEATPPVSEDMPARPTAPYGASKLAAEGYLSAYANSYGFDATSLRFSNVYGRYSYHKGSVIAAFLKSIVRRDPITVFGDGTQTRDYVFADDLSDGIVRALEAGCPGVYQLGTGTGTSISEVIEIIRELVEPEYPVRIVHQGFRDGEIRHTWCDISKAAAAFHYSPRTSLREGLQKTWDWFRASNQETISKSTCQ